MRTRIDAPAADPSIRFMLDSRFHAAASGGFGNPDWDTASSRVLIVRLSTFADVESSTPHLVVFSETRAALPEAFIDFAFFASSRDRAILRSVGEGPFVGSMSGKPPAAFDLVLVSNSFALELVNLPHLFRGTGRSARKRGANGERSAIFVMGGSNASASSAVFGPDEDGDEDSFFDGIYYGEGEGEIGRLARILADPAVSADRRLEDADREIPGFRRVGSAKRPRVARTNPANSPTGYPVLDSAHAKTVRLEIARGCPAFCSFCFEGWERKPYRERKLSSIVADAIRARRDTGASVAELYCFNFNMHSEIVTVLFRAHGVFADVKALSQRIDVLARHPVMVDVETASGKRVFTLGIEGISARIRAYYRKSVATTDMEKVCDLLFSRGARELKLFYVISGLETGDDLEEFEGFVARIAAARDRHGAGTRVMFSAGFLVRYPGTPLGRPESLPPGYRESDPERTARAFKDAVARAGFESRTASSFREFLACRAIVAESSRMGDLEEAADSGARYDVSLSKGAFPRAGAMLERGRNPVAPDPVRAASDDALDRAAREASGFADSGYCLGGTCLACGACDDPTDRSTLLGHAIRMPGTRGPVDAIARLVAEKRRLPRAIFEPVFPPDCYGACAEAMEARALRDLFRHAPVLVERVLDAKEAFPPGWDPRSALPGYCGRGRIAFFAKDAAALEEIGRATGWPRLPGDAPAKSVELELVPVACLASGLVEAVAGLAREERVPFSRTEDGDHVTWEAASRSRKGLFRAIVARDGSRATIEAGPKFAVSRMEGLAGAGKLPGRNVWERVEILRFNP